MQGKLTTATFLLGGKQRFLMEPNQLFFPLSILVKSKDLQRASACFDVFEDVEWMGDGWLLFPIMGEVTIRTKSEPRWLYAIGNLSSPAPKALCLGITVGTETGSSRHPIAMAANEPFACLIKKTSLMQGPEKWKKMLDCNQNNQH